MDIVQQGNTPIERWQSRIRHLRQFLRGWEKNLNAAYRKLKEQLLHTIDQLDIKADTILLNAAERATKKEAEIQLGKLLRDEESKWAQRAKVRYIQEGGNNTPYFHIMANGRHRKKKFFQLEQDEGTIVGENNLKVFISEYYKKLFGAPDSNFFSMDEASTNDMPQISADGNNILTTEFTEKEVYEAIS